MFDPSDFFGQPRRIKGAPLFVSFVYNPDLPVETKTGRLPGPSHVRGPLRPSIQIPSMDLKGLGRQKNTFSSAPTGCRYRRQQAPYLCTGLPLYAPTKKTTFARKAWAPTTAEDRQPPAAFIKTNTQGVGRPAYRGYDFCNKASYKGTFPQNGQFLPKPATAAALGTIGPRVYFGRALLIAIQRLPDYLSANGQRAVTRTRAIHGPSSSRTAVNGAMTTFSSRLARSEVPEAKTTYPKEKSRRAAMLAAGHPTLLIWRPAQRRLPNRPDEKVRKGTEHTGRRLI